MSMRKNISLVLVTVLVLTISSCKWLFKKCKGEIIFDRTEICKSQIAPGIEYTKYKTDAPCVIHVVKFDPKLVKSTLEPAIGQREEVSSIAHKAKACVAVNGGNYRRGGRYNGNRLNVMKAYGVLYNDPQLHRGAIGWTKSEAKWHIDYIFITWEFFIDGNRFSIDRLNQPRKKGEAVLYTSTVDSGVVKGRGGVDIIIKDKHVVDIISSGDSSVPQDGFIYQLDIDDPLLKKIKTGMQVNLSYDVKSKKKQRTNIWDTADFLLGGAGFILDEGKILHNEIYAELGRGERLFLSADEGIANFHPRKMQEYLIKKDHPRTALGIDSKGFQYLVVVDGRSSLSKGLSLPNLAYFMLTELHCKQALNIGGGGCSTLVIKGKVVNNPSQKAERPVSEALCLHVPES